VLALLVIYSLRKPYYIGIAYFLGYLNDFLKRKEKISEIEIREYYKNKWKQIVKEYLKLSI
jgi:hypothetical protein